MHTSANRANRAVAIGHPCHEKEIGAKIGADCDTVFLLFSFVFLGGAPMNI